MKTMEFFVLVFLVMFAQDLRANDQGHWSSARALQEQGQFTEAIQEYQNISEWDQRPDVLYNLGVAAMSSAQLGEAILFFEKAYRFAPSDARIKHNLEAARQRIENPYAQQSNFLQAAGLQLFAALHPNVWAVLLIILTFLSGWLWVFFRKNKKRALAWSMWSVTAIITLLYFSASLYLNDQRYGVALRFSENIFGDAQLSDTLNRSIPEGTKVRILKQDDQVVFFRLPNGLEAYLPSDFIERI